jgi:NitT/TauT family transport system ATP-binding protein
VVLAFSANSLSVDVGEGPQKRRIIEGVDLDVSEGEFVCILGESGVGKTTLLRVFAGLLPAAPGSHLELEGRSIDGPPEGAVVVFQNYAGALLPWRTAQRNVEFGLESRLPKRERRRVARQALDLVGLSERAADFPAQLSGGMQQRVQIARALAVRPRLLLMDEPFGALDAMTRESLQDELLRIHRLERPTIIFITHDVDEAVYLADRLVVLKGQPASVGMELRSDLPRERDQVTTKELPSFLALRHQIYRAVRYGCDDDR